jgi:hypothetical protein
MIVCLDAKENIKNSLVYLGLDNTGASPINFLTRLNDDLASVVHLISLPFFSISMINLTISTKLGINLLKKFIFPKNDWISFLFLGMFIVSIASIHLGSTLIPYFETI